MWYNAVRVVMAVMRPNLYVLHASSFCAPLRRSQNTVADLLSNLAMDAEEAVAAVAAAEVPRRVKEVGPQQRQREQQLQREALQPIVRVSRGVPLVHKHPGTLTECPRLGCSLDRSPLPRRVLYSDL